MPAPRLKPWKPRACADCGKPHPSFSRDAGRADAPWRCLTCDETAEPMPVVDPFAGLPDTGAGQGALL